MADIEELKFWVGDYQERIRQLPLKRDMSNPHWQERLKELQYELESMEVKLACAIEKAEKLANSLTISVAERTYIIVSPRKSWVKGRKGSVRCRVCKREVQQGYSLTFGKSGGLSPIAACGCDHETIRCEEVEP